MGTSVVLLAAFGAGGLSFISPFVLPFIPAYLASVSGAPVTDAHGPAVPRARALAAALAFVLGVMLVFAALGASAGLVGERMAGRLPLLGRLAGLIVVAFGLQTMGALPRLFPSRLSGGARARGPAGPGRAALVGIAFALGWLPCLGPILAGVLALAAVSNTAAGGAELLAAYSAGLGAPFLVTSLAARRLLAASGSLRRHYRAIEIACGALLVAIGALVVADRLTIVARWFTP